MYCKECLEKEKNSNQANISVIQETINNNINNTVVDNKLKEKKLLDNDFDKSFNYNKFCTTCGKLMDAEENVCIFCNREKVGFLKRIFYFLFEGLITVIIFCSLIFLQIVINLDVTESFFCVFNFVFCLLYNFVMNYFYVYEYESFSILKNFFIGSLFLFVITIILTSFSIGGYVLVALFIFVWFGFFGVLFAAFVSFVNYVLNSILLNRH